MKLKKIRNPNGEPREGKKFRLFDFQMLDCSHFRIQMFGVNEIGETCAIMVEDMKPFFFVKVGDHWTQREASNFGREIKKRLGFQGKCLLDVQLLDSNKLYEFTGDKKYRFVKLTFETLSAFKKTRGFWFRSGVVDGVYTRTPIPFRFEGFLELYESKIPPLLRYFHIRNICPSGWVEVYDYLAEKPEVYSTTCDYEFLCRMEHLEPLPTKETAVPYKICSFDIEASSSHGDFPLPVKDYKRVATQMTDAFQKRIDTGDVKSGDDKKAKLLVKSMMLSAFDLGTMKVDCVYPKNPVNSASIKKITERFLTDVLHTMENDESKEILKITTLLDRMATHAKSLETEEADGEVEEESNEVQFAAVALKTPKGAHKMGVCDILFSDMTRDQKIKLLNEAMTSLFPSLKGDEVTFIGSTFLKSGEKEPYKNHCLVVGSCDKVANVVIESVETERECLIRWAQLIQDENPDIIIGYNIFGFDYEFMFQRSRENHCVEEFMALSRVMGEKSYKEFQGEKTLEQTKNKLASGEYDLHYPNISGRLQIDLLFYFRRDYTLASYKLDDVAGTFIRDDIKRIVVENGRTKLYSKNLSGLHVDDFIHIEIASFTTDYYRKGKKFRVLDIEKQDEFNVISIEGECDLDASTQSLKWGMAKDDVTPQDIFRLSKESATSRAIVAKYCIQDCNLVQNLMLKIDVLTGYTEMARICSVPISFLVFRGQGIKLTSYVAKICREKKTLMPDLEHAEEDDGYEGAIVLPPKCAMYGDNPVACVDYSSLYPSIAKGWNLSPDSKVWTKMYDCSGTLTKINDVQVTAANQAELEQKAHRFDFLPKYQYIETEFDTFEIVRTYTVNGKLGKKQKVKNGTKKCRWAIFPDQEGIIPCIIGDLLSARKNTRKAAEKEADPFIANILDKRQLGYKVTANSLYGQMGSRVSTFFEKDVAASITAIGRMMITYAKRMVEEIYGDSVYTTKEGETVRTKSTYIYGDTDSVFFSFNLEEMDGRPIRGRKALEITIALAEELADLCSLFLPPPMKLAYEKTLMSFILLSKKRYVGMLFETNPEKGKLKFMGLPLKRRDSCDYLKDVYGGILTILMKEPENIRKAIDFLNTSLDNLIEGRVAMEKLMITKALRSDYKKPGQIAHKVLADRIGERDPGNKPKPGERIKFVFITSEDKNALLGERIETPDFIVKNKTLIDYHYYITNQLMNPLQQLLGLAMESIYKEKKMCSKEYRRAIAKLEAEFPDLEVFMKKREKYCSAQVKKVLFDPFLNQIFNKRNGIQTLFKFFQRT